MAKRKAAGVAADPLIGQKMIAERSKQAKARAKKLQYHSIYNSEHRDRLLANKKTRYATDPAYRQMVIAAARSSQERKRKLKAEARAAAGTNDPSRKNVCGICWRVKPRQVKPLLMLLERKFEVLMYSLAELSKEIGRHKRTVKKWVAEKVIPAALYRLNGVHLWTEDQVEAIRDTMNGFDLRPPISFEKSGVIVAVRKAWDALLPVGIDVTCYSHQASENRFRRAAPKKTKKLCRPNVKYCPGCGRLIQAPVQPITMLVDKKFEVLMYPFGAAAVVLHKHRKTMKRWVKEGTLSSIEYFTPQGAPLLTADQLDLMKAALDVLEAAQPGRTDMQKFSQLTSVGFAALKPNGIDESKYLLTGRGTYARGVSGAA